ncbi:zinc finger lsd1 subclass family protein, putative [Ichthyophthirius multifiliis]|uniref:Zinc finger lsd1 subclass family protein, putative n=1 Tax=Ichthyophthirius multifiliis TaxID=5932 RepID=G0QP83_ICHMU|nr:zinc finger lsd1 subclass family protein, putative [Ichthyophthirius multifiliis]EGR32972.1 zinc finger lsd1 subclass family protein, putative [Ichthyophthirius multifiliis]|eukprot:XP_004036958.1 zinc finger lsd1 subclass family protein, putative [Ichthyophthirius multifiliis]
MLDTWDSGEFFIVLINGNEAFRAEKVNGSNQLCGFPTNEDAQSANFVYKTSDKNIEVLFTNNSDEGPNTESIGISQFIIYVNECMAECLECTDNISCSKCQVGKYLDAGRTCNDCNHKCATCSDATDCVTCFHNRVPPACDCPAHSYDNSNYQEACFPCSNISVGCSTCDNKTCQACLAPRFLDGNSCVNDCPAGKWGNTVNRQCADCLDKCVTCSNAIDCDTCFENRVAPACDCPAHSYDNSNYQEACSPCSNISVGCSTCDNKTCQACLAPRFLDGNSCVNDCPAGKWGNTVNRQCADCLAKCVTCSNENTCDICFENRVPQQSCTMCSTFSIGCATCSSTECLKFKYRF